MKIKTSLLFFLISLFFTSSILSNTDSRSEDFFVTVSKNLLARNYCKAILFSNEKGEWLNYLVTEDENDEEDLRIDFKKNPTDKVLVSLFFYSKAITYVNIESGTYLDLSNSRLSRTRGSRNVKMQIEGVNNVEDFKNFSQSNYQPKKLETINGNYIGYFHNNRDEAIYCLIQSNGEKRYRYFYDENSTENGKRPRSRYNADYLKLGVCTNTKRLTLPAKDKWSGRIKVQFIDSEKPFNVFNHYETEDTDETNYIELPLPTGQFAYTHVEVSSKDFKINKLYKGIPKNIVDPKIETEIITADQTHLEFKTSKNVGFYTAKFTFEEEASEDSEEEYLARRNWIFVGIDQNVSFELPVVPDDIVNQLPKITFNEAPVFLVLTNYNVAYEDTYDSWILPHTLLDPNWQTENGLIGKINQIKIN